MLLWFFAAPLSMEYNNGFAYFEISFVTLVITTAIAYFIIRGLRYIIDAKQVGQRKFTAEITVSGETVELDALADSGNLLTDYFTGLPVIVCPQSAVMPPEKFRLLPYNTIDSNGLIPVFRAEKIIIKTDGVPGKSVNALIGITDNNSPAIFNPKLLI